MLCTQSSVRQRTFVYKDSHHLIQILLKVITSDLVIILQKIHWFFYVAIIYTVSGILQLLDNRHIKTVLTAKWQVGFSNYSIMFIIPKISVKKLLKFLKLSDAFSTFCIIVDRNLHFPQVVIFVVDHYTRFVSTNTTTWLAYLIFSQYVQSKIYCLNTFHKSVYLDA